MNLRRILDWKFCIALAFLLAVSSFCWNSLQSTAQVQSLIRIADSTTSQSEKNGHLIQQLQRQLAAQSDVAHDRSLRDEAQNKALIRVLRKAGIKVPDSLINPGPGGVTGPKARPGHPGKPGTGKPGPTGNPTHTPGGGDGMLCNLNPALCGLPTVPPLPSLLPGLP